jgi:hypothetical protein
METTELPNVEVKINPADLDDDGFVSIWNIASSSTNGDAKLARQFASKLLGFLCKQRCSFVVVSPTDAKYLDEWFERDKSILHDWKPESEKVDVLTQHACVPAESFTDFLTTNKFKATTKYNPTRANREDWFANDWNVG